jgi:hypothetical protein
MARMDPLTISYLYVEPSEHKSRQGRLSERLIHSVASGADRKGFAGIQMSGQAAAAMTGSLDNAVSLADGARGGVFDFCVPGPASGPA